jgi:hypothetical protein
MHMTNHPFHRSAVAGLFVLATGALAHAGTAASFTLHMDVEGNPSASWTGQPTLSIDPLGQFTVPDGSYDSPSGVFSVGWEDIHGHIDPATFAIVNVTNTTAATQTYDLVLGLTGVVLGGPTQMHGSVQGGVTDTSAATGFGGPGATLSTAGAGTSLYTGMIDGNPALQLLIDPTAVVAGAGASNSTFANSAVLPGPAVTANISIRHHFTLTPGDSASFTSFFEVVPEPTTIGLLGLGSVLLVRRRR